MTPTDEIAALRRVVAAAMQHVDLVMSGAGMVEGFPRLETAVRAYRALPAASPPAVATPAEVEALRRERDAAVADAFALSAACCPHAYPHENGSLGCAEIDTLRAANARLREALAEIAKPLDARDLPALRGEPVSWRREVARAALAKEPTP